MATLGLTLFAAVGTSAQSVSATPSGVETPDRTTHRMFNSGPYRYVRVQFSHRQAPSGVRIEYSIDNGTTWPTLIPDTPAAGASVATFGEWVELPEDLVVNEYDVAVRAMTLADPAITVQPVFYHLQLR